MSERRAGGPRRQWLVASVASTAVAVALFVLVPPATATGAAPLAPLAPLAPSPLTPAQAQDPALVAEGGALYLLQCSSCHGADAKGTERGPTLIGVGAASADFYLTTGRMPAAQGTGAQANRKPVAFDRHQIDALDAYVGSLAPGPAIPVVDLAGTNEARGGELYRANCAACHQAAGIGGALSYGNHAPALDQATPVQVVEAMRIGPGQMPVFDQSVIDEADARDIAAYVQYLHKPDDRGGFSLGRSGPFGEGFVALTAGLGGLTVLGAWVVGRRRHAG